MAKDAPKRCCGSTEQAVRIGCNGYEFLEIIFNKKKKHFKRGLNHTHCDVQVSAVMNVNQSAN